MEIIFYIEKSSIIIIIREVIFRNKFNCYSIVVLLKKIKKIWYIIGYL